MSLYLIAPSDYLVYTPILRTVGPYLVEGPGSRAVLAFGRGRKLEGFTRVWKRGVPGGRTRVRTTLTAEALRTEIERRLSRGTHVRAEVYEVRIIYYDGGGGYLQPLHRYSARLWGSDTPEKHPAFVLGYVPYAPLVEAVPGLEAAPSIQLPRNLPTSHVPAVAGHMLPLGTGSPPHRLGRFVARSVEPEWTQSAEAFLHTLHESGASSSFDASPIVWLEPGHFTSTMPTLNSVRLALVEGHGTWLTIYTESVGSAEVEISSVGSMGARSGGSLADLIIHSCEVIPSEDDLGSGWAAPWWNVFHGVRNVLGYRTRMFYDDLAMTHYGQTVGFQVPIVSSWLSAVMSLNRYAGRPESSDPNGLVHPLGRPSAVSMCEHDSDTLLQDYEEKKATCLRAWWVRDQLASR